MTTLQQEQLRNNGYRLTPQRQIILEVLHDLGGHLTAGQIYEQVQHRSSAIDRATVYRTLSLLQELHIVHSSRIAGQVYYELADEEPHHHLVCNNCGYIQRLDDHHFRHLVTHLIEEHNFIASMSHLTITGLCGACQETQKTEEAAAKSA
ncbi:MAG: transcriptional repressor [Anaerolineales bacterium]|nr:transcriptional repressor [Anaerolineales bacterium]